MKQRTIAKLGALISVVLFLIGVGVFSFAKLDEVARGKELNLFSLVPANSLGAFETDNIDLLVGEFAQVAYAEQLDLLQGGSSWSGVLNGIKKYMSDNTHGLSHHIHRLVVSFHSEKYVAQESVVYFRLEDSGKRIFRQILQENSMVKTPKKELYNGEDIWIYAMGNKRFLAVYEGKGFLVASYQKRLVEEVITAKKEGTSLWNNESFVKGYHGKESNFVTLYARSASLPLLSESQTHCWSEYDLHLNSEVFYLSGEVFNSESCMCHVDTELNQLSCIYEDDLLVVAGENLVDSCISSVIARPNHTLFEECVSNLSREAIYIMVADMDRVLETPDRYRSYLPAFFIDYAAAFRPFILSVQLTKRENRLYHIFVFTYKE